MSLGLKYRNGTLNLSLKLQSVIFIDIDTLDFPLAAVLQRQQTCFNRLGNQLSCSPGNKCMQIL